MIHSYGMKESSAVEGGTALAITRAIAREYFPTREKIRLLDVGCGSGSFLATLPPVFEKTGVDYNGAAPIRVNVSYEPLPFPDGSFDIVTAWQVFEHLENPFFAGREIRRVLVLGGLFLMSVPNIKRLYSRLYFFLHGGIPRWSKRNDHIFVPLESVLKKAVLCGFRPVGRTYADGAAFPLLRELTAKNEYYIAQRIEWRKPSPSLS